MPVWGPRTDPGPSSGGSGSAVIPGLQSGGFSGPRAGLCFVDTRGLADVAFRPRLSLPEPRSLPELSEHRPGHARPPSGAQLHPGLQQPRSKLPDPSWTEATLGPGPGTLPRYPCLLFRAAPGTHGSLHKAPVPASKTRSAWGVTESAGIAGPQGSQGGGGPAHRQGLVGSVGSGVKVSPLNSPF